MGQLGKHIPDEKKNGYQKMKEHQRNIVLNLSIHIL